jgi:hypothetical protein
MKTHKLKKKLNKIYKPRSKVKALPTKIIKSKKNKIENKNFSSEIDMRDLCA